MKKQSTIFAAALLGLALAAAACAPETPAPKEYLLSFDVNGGSQSFAQKALKAGDLLPLPTPSKKGYRFKGWADGSGALYADGAAMPQNDLVLFAQWEKITYVLAPDGEYVYFGNYPQTLAEQELGDVLTAKAGPLPTEENEGVWTDYGYYAEGKPANYMWHADVTFEGERYRGVYFSQYRPSNTDRAPSAENSYQDDNGFEAGKVYWFKYEPLLWRILETRDGCALLMSEYIVDAQGFNLSTQAHSATVSANNYRESSVRVWLNDTFYSAAFDDYDKAIIQKTVVDNGPSSSVYEENDFLCEDTEDFVWLLSNADTVNTSYGFGGSYTENDAARRIKATDYGKCLGVYTDPENDEYPGCGTWWLRSPDWYLNDCAFLINTAGYGQGRIGVNYTHGGIVPVLKIKL